MGLAELQRAVDEGEVAGSAWQRLGHRGRRARRRVDARVERLVAVVVAEAVGRALESDRLDVRALLVEVDGAAESRRLSRRLDDGGPGRRRDAGDEVAGLHVPLLAGGEVGRGAGDQVRLAGVAGVQAVEAGAAGGAVGGRSRRRGRHLRRERLHPAGRRRIVAAPAGQRAEPARLVVVVAADVRLPVALADGVGTHLERRVQQGRVLDLEQELAEAVAQLRGLDHRLPAGGSAVLDRHAVRGGGAPGEVLIGRGVVAAHDLAGLVVAPDRAFRLGHHAGIEPALLVGRGTEMVVGEDGAYGAVVARLAVGLLAAAQVAILLRAGLVLEV